MPASDVSGAVKIYDKGPRYRSRRFELAIVSRDGSKGMTIRHAPNASTANRLAEILRDMLGTWVES